MDAIDYAAQSLGIKREELVEALRRGRIRAEREERRRNDGAVGYNPVTPQYALVQAVRDGFVSPVVFHLSESE